MADLQAKYKMIPKRLFSVHEAGHYLGVSHWTVRGLINDGAIMYCRIGRKILIDQRDLDTYVEGLREKAII